MRIPNISFQDTMRFFFIVCAGLFVLLIASEYISQEGKIIISIGIVIAAAIITAIINKLKKKKQNKK